MAVGVPSWAALPPGALVTVTLCAIEVVCCVCAGNVSEPGDNVRLAAASPIPFRLTVNCPPGALDEGNVSKPFRLPEAVGVKNTWIVQLPLLGASVAPQFVESE